jgi:predicted nicotinamide N-methyase
MTAESDEDHQRRFIRSLFVVTGDDAAATAAAVVDDEDELDEDITEHVWICPHDDDGGAASSSASASAPEPIVIRYHLAYRSPGHGNRLWNSSDCIAQHLLHPEYRSKMFGKARLDYFAWPPEYCIEFGAGAALPSLALLREGAGRVVITDRYVNERTFDALRMSLEKNATSCRMSEEEMRVRGLVMPHTWGEDIGELLITQRAAGDGEETARKANLLIASDCIYNPMYHDALLRSATAAMDPIDGLFVVGYSLHGNVPAHQTLNFFDVARRDYGLIIANEYMKEYADGQRGIGCDDGERGAVYIKVLIRS